MYVNMTMTKFIEDNDPELLHIFKLHVWLSEVIALNFASIGSHGHIRHSSLPIGMPCSLSKIMALFPSLHL